MNKKFFAIIAEEDIKEKLSYIIFGKIYFLKDLKKICIINIKKSANHELDITVIENIF